MLRQRLMTAVVLIVPLVAAILWLPNRYFALLLAAVVALAAWEWSALSGTADRTVRVVYCSMILLLLLATSLLPFTGGMLVIGLGLGGWLVALAAVIGYEQGWRARRLPQGFMWLAGVVLLIPAWLALVLLHGGPGGEYWVLAVFVLIWIADSVAYFTGRRWGSHRLAPVVSPGKTLEGLAGALTVVLVLTAAAAAAWQSDLVSLPAVVLLALATVLMSVLGDLAESLVKRLAGVKDSGSILPGHGGILDRIDSLTAAAPVFLAGLWWLGVYS